MSITRTPGKEVDTTPSPSPQAGKPSYRKPEPPMATREDINRLPMKAEAKTVLAWLLDQPAKVYERNEIAKALGMRAAFVERGLVFLRRRCPWLRLPKQHPDTGAAFHGRHGYIPADSHLRRAWKAKAPAEKPPKVPNTPQGDFTGDPAAPAQAADKKGGANG